MTEAFDYFTLWQVGPGKRLRADYRGNDLDDESGRASGAIVRRADVASAYVLFDQVSVQTDSVTEGPPNVGIADLLACALAVIRIEPSSTYALHPPYPSVRAKIPVRLVDVQERTSFDPWRWVWRSWTEAPAEIGPVDRSMFRLEIIPEYLPTFYGELRPIICWTEIGLVLRVMTIIANSLGYRLTVEYVASEGVHFSVMREHSAYESPRASSSADTSLGMLFRERQSGRLGGGLFGTYLRNPVGFDADPFLSCFDAKQGLPFDGKAHLDVRTLYLTRSGRWKSGDVEIAGVDKVLKPLSGTTSLRGGNRRARAEMLFFVTADLSAVVSEEGEVGVVKSFIGAGWHGYEQCASATLAGRVLRPVREFDDFEVAELLDLPRATHVLLAGFGGLAREFGAVHNLV
ncbi:hypothetical protein [Rathayibacter tritici]|nr:hypothetical protein [Rathayibacter tritici]